MFFRVWLTQTEIVSRKFSHADERTHSTTLSVIPRKLARHALARDMGELLAIRLKLSYFRTLLKKKLRRHIQPLLKLNLILTTTDI